jgi:hypothetical protein
METKIISAFPGVGKTYYHERNKGISIDSDSSHFSWVKDSEGNNTKERNPEFPNNYINHIKENIGKYKYIFVSSHEEVRNSLKENGIEYYLIYPNLSRKSEFIQRYIQRGSPEGFVNLISENWESWIEKIEEEKEEGFTKVCMTLDHLENELTYIEIVENTSDLLKVNFFEYRN